MLVQCRRSCQQLQWKKAVKAGRDGLHSSRLFYLEHHPRKLTPVETTASFFQSMQNPGTYANAECHSFCRYASLFLQIHSSSDHTVQCCCSSVGMTEHLHQLLGNLNALIASELSLYSTVVAEKGGGGKKGQGGSPTKNYSYEERQKRMGGVRKTGRGVQVLLSCHNQHYRSYFRANMPSWCHITLSCITHVNVPRIEPSSFVEERPIQSFHQKYIFV